MTLPELEKRWPSIQWRKPLLVRWPSGDKFACRICIANLGLKRTSDHQWRSEDDAVAHINQHIATSLN